MVKSQYGKKVSKIMKLCKELGGREEEFEKVINLVRKEFRIRL
jgi:hypothetical protein